MPLEYGKYVFIARMCQRQQVLMTYRQKTSIIAIYYFLILKSMLVIGRFLQHTSVPYLAIKEYCFDLK